MKIAYKDMNLRAESLALIEVCNQIIETYQAAGLRLTLRQLYYQLVTRNVIRNTEREYKRVGGIVSDGRLVGRIDWDAIEDRVRQPKPPPEYDSLKDLITAAIHSFRLPRRRTQPFYVELWVEKDALAGVLEPIARAQHIVLMVNRGYSSQSAMHESANRFISATTTSEGVIDKASALIYVGDHDPSGEDMVRDVRDRLFLFGADVAVRKVALTRDQVDTYNPPPNPAKLSDSRAANYVAEHGDSSWEVDALPPEVLTGIIQAAIAEFTQQGLIDKVVVAEKKDVAKLQHLAGEAL